MKKNIILITIFSIIAIVAVTGIFFKHSDRSGRHMGRHMERQEFQDENMPMMEGNFIGRHFTGPKFMRKALHMTEEQITKIESLNEKYGAEHRIRMDILDDERKTMRKLLSVDSPDLKKVRALLEKNSGIHVELRMLRIKQGIEITKIMTAKQIELLKDKRKRTFKRRGKHFWQQK